MTTPDKALIVRLIDESDAHFIGDVRDRRTIGSLMGEAAARLTALLSENAALRAAVERKDAALRLARDSHGKLLLTDPPQGALKRENEALREALQFTLICAENGHDATANTRAALSPALKGEA